MRLSRALPALLLAPVLATVLTGCRADVRVEVDVHADGGATAGVVVHLDEEAAAWLAAADIDPVAIMSGAAVDPWTFEPGPGDGLELWLRRDVDDASQLGDVLRGLADGLTVDDPAVLVDVDVRLPDRRTVHLVGDVEVRAPGSAALLVDGREVGPGAQELAALATQFVTARLVVRLPGELVAHDGDRVVDGVVFDLTVGEARPVSVESLTAGTSVPTWVGALVAVSVVALATAVGVRVRSRRQGTPHGSEAIRTGE